MRLALQSIGFHSARAVDAGEMAADSLLTTARRASELSQRNEPTRERTRGAVALHYFDRNSYGVPGMRFCKSCLGPRQFRLANS
jgi:hypothetical protein